MVTVSMAINSATLLVLFSCLSVRADLDSALASYLTSTNARNLPGQNTDAVKSLYNLYKQEFKRNAKSLADDQQRLAAFTETLSAITDQYRKGQQTFSLGLNEFSDRTGDELSKYRGAQAPSVPFNSTNNQSNVRLATWDERSLLSKVVAALPSSYDLVTRVVSGTSVPVVSQTSIDFPSLHSHYRSNLSKIRAPVDPVTLSPSSLCSSFSSLCN